MQNPRFQQQGFTLIEIAIVLVIIGLLLGGVLKGQELIESGKVKNVVNDMNGVTAALNTYRDRYKQLPGDDTGGGAGGVAVRGAAWTGVGPGNGNGVIGGAAANPFAAGVENILFWRHLRAAGLVTGSPAVAGVPALPKNAFGGQMGITTGVFGISGNAIICLQNIPGKAAAAIDNQFDDGVANTGSVRGNGAVTVPSAAPTAAAPGTAAYNEDFNYTLCRSA